MFLQGPIPTRKQLFQQPKSATLAVSREDLEAHLKKTYLDTNQELPLEETAGRICSAAPGIKFNNKPPNLQEVAAVIYQARAKSAPGPYGVPYLLHKRCPNVLKWLHKILRSAWNNIKVSKEWMTAEGVYIPKEQNSKEIHQFRPISLLNNEGKIFFSVMATRLTKYLTENGYINTSVQKGSIPGVSGCLEHATMIGRAAAIIDKERPVISTAKGQSNPPSPSFTIFTTESGAKKWCGRSNTASTLRKGLLDSCDDWEISVDLPEWDKHPDVIRRTTLRPNIVIHSTSTQRFIMVELTVPYESRMEQAHT
ncbi:polyprotein [Elysia marginata]|uniref:Polyprotein n=1 Tax=Elysia marginata TaxID=1093978 RepID=A0AAV4F7U1_9GAST|nr:polyprotein [Elysia marginata]